MPDPSTARLALYKSKSDGSELVNYPQDLGQNWDKVDLAVGLQACTSTTRPATPFSGKGIMETDTAYRTSFSNGTAPASASWVEIPNSSATFNNNLNLASGKQINIGGSGSVASFAALNPAANTDLLTGRVTGDTASRYLVDTDGTTFWGPGGATATDTSLARTAPGRLALTGTNAALTIGSATYRNALSSGPTTVANTITETVIATATIPANDAVAGAIYRMTAYGVASTTLTPNFTITARLGGVAGTTMAIIGPSATAANIAGRPWHAVFYLRCVSAGAAAVWSPTFAVYHNLTTATQTGNNIQLPNTTADQTVNSTVSQAMVLTWTWNAASTSNTATCTGIIFERIA